MNAKSYLTPRVIAALLIFIVGIPALPLLISRRWNWWEAWVYLLLNVFSFVISRFLAARRNPDILKERAQFMQHGNTQPWDNRLAPLLGIGGGLIPIVAGLDALNGWTEGFSTLGKWVSLFVLLAGLWLGSSALIENRFFSGTVRLQPERGQHVVSAGPYKLMRHPGYAGALLTYLATPIFLESFWVFLPVLFTTAVMVVRTTLEDRFLQHELEGYRKYAQKVRYRLLPGVW